MKHFTSFVFSACSRSSGPHVGGQTNWLLACDSSDEREGAGGPLDAIRV